MDVRLYMCAYAYNRAPGDWKRMSKMSNVISDVTRVVLHVYNIHVIYYIYIYYYSCSLNTHTALQKKLAPRPNVVRTKSTWKEPSNKSTTLYADHPQLPNI